MGLYNYNSYVSNSFLLLSVIQSPAKPKKKTHHLHNAAACVELYCILMKRVLYMVSNQRQHTASKLCDAITHIFKGVHQAKLVGILIGDVIDILLRTLQVNPAARFGSEIEKKIINVFKYFGSLVEKQYGTHHTSEQLMKLAPLFKVTLTSSNKSVKSEACRLWKSCFSSTKFSVPFNLYEVLKECGLPPASLIDVQENIDESLNLSPKENVPSKLLVQYVIYFCKKQKKLTIKILNLM